LPDKLYKLLAKCSTLRYDWIVYNILNILEIDDNNNFIVVIENTNGNINIINNDITSTNVIVINSVYGLIDDNELKIYQYNPQIEEKIRLKGKIMFYLVTWKITMVI